jgi:FecR protein
MTEPPEYDRDQDRPDDDIGRVLTEALHTEPPSPAALQRLRDAASREWLLAMESPARAAPWRNPVLAIAAALLMVIVGAVWFVWPVGNPQSFGVVARADARVGEIVEGWLRQRPLKGSATVHVGDKLVAHGPVLIALTSGGTLRIAPDTVLEVSTASEARLQRGLIYLDFPPGKAFGTALQVRTRVGTVQHVGTEFEVLSNDQIVRIRVREGSVRLRTSSQETLVDAGTQLTASQDGSLTRGAIEPYGRDWLWVAALAPDYEIEGQPLLIFLQWAARELGRPLKFADQHAREVAERTILHGSIKGREPLDALSSVLSTTSLTYEIRGDTIWVQSGRGT